MEENEIVLSGDLIVITAEINSYKQVAGQAVFEIGKRLKHVKENDLAHGQWEKWCRSSINIEPQQVNKYIRVYSRFSNRNSGFDLGVAALNELVDFTDEQIDQTHKVPSTGESKTVEDMTVKELREVKAELKLKEEELRLEKLATQALIDTAQSFQSYASPSTVEIVKEVTPLHVEEELKELKESLEAEKADKESFRKKSIDTEAKKAELELKLKEIEDYEKSEKAFIKNLKQEKEKLELQAHISISSLQVGIHKFIEQYAPSVFLQGAVASSTFMMRDDLLDSIIALEEFTRTLREMLYSKVEVNQNNVIELN